MTYEEEMRFISMVIKTVSENPEMFSKIVMACQNGVTKAIDKHRELAMDMETIAVAFSTMSKGKYTEKNQKWIHNLLKAKLEKHKDYSYINWGSTLEELEKSKA